MPRTVKPPDERRQELLDIGIDLFLHNGSAGVSIQNVISRANVATGLFYYYFQSKEAFLEEAIGRHVAGFSDSLMKMLIENDGNALANIKKAITAFSAHMTKTSPLMRDERINTPQFHIVMHNILEKLCPVIERCIEDGIAEGAFHVVSPPLTARFILNGLTGILHAGAHHLPTQDMHQEIERIVLSALGIKKP